MNRRDFLLATPTVALATTATAAVPPQIQTRRDRAYRMRVEAAQRLSSAPMPAHADNGDDARYPNFIGSFTKALPHDARGHGQPAAYQALKRALTTRREAHFDAIPLGGTVPLANPQGALAFCLEGGDPQDFALPAPPALASDATAVEMIELYWRAVTRDVPFAHYEDHADIGAAAADLDRQAAYRGPRRVTPNTLFRGTTAGELQGPFISQFLVQDVPMGAMTLTQRSAAPAVGDDHLTDFAAWLANQNGQPPTTTARLGEPRFLATNRDLAEYVHRDFSIQAYQNAALILLSYGTAALTTHNPYKRRRNQGGFVTFGGPAILDLLSRAGQAALKAAWFQKWGVHRRLRPEAYGARVHQQRTGAATYPLPDTLLNAAVLARVHQRQGSYLLSQVYPEGCPTHPAYPAGHAAIAGACVTVLKACFDAQFVLPNPLVAAADGLRRVPYSGEPLSVGGELHKLAANMAFGRDTAGVHWRSDGAAGLQLGEAVALRLLQDDRLTTTEGFAGFSLTDFAGRTVTG